jgi:hypothetical protein
MIQNGDTGASPIPIIIPNSNFGKDTLRVCCNTDLFFTISRYTDPTWIVYLEGKWPQTDYNFYIFYR